MNNGRCADKQRRRNWSVIDPVKYFKAHYQGKITSRRQLKKEDNVLYDKLRRLGTLDEVLSDQNKADRDWSVLDPVKYFKEHYAGRITSRRQLAKEDHGLYCILRKRGMLDELLSDQNKDYRDWSVEDPMKYFREEYECKISNRSQLQKQDQGLYDILKKRGLLDTVFPAPSSKGQLEHLLQKYVGEAE